MEEAAIGDRTNVSTSSSVKPKTLLGQELTRYLAEGIQPDEAQFNLASFWSRRIASTLEAAEEEAVHDRGMPHLALLARLYHGVEATSCRTERTFSAVFPHRSLAVEYGTVQGGADDVLAPQPALHS